MKTYDIKMLFPNLPLELNLAILAKMNIVTILKCMEVSKKIYFFLKEDVLTKIYPYFNFEKEDIRLLHCAIMYEKRNIIKWLINHKIYYPKKSSIPNPFYRYPRSIVPVDYTLSLSVFYSSFSIMKFLVESGIQPIFQTALFGLELKIAEDINDQQKLLYLRQLQIFKKISRTSFINYDYAIFNFKRFANQYKRNKSILIKK